MKSLTILISLTLISCSANKMIQIDGTYSEDLNCFQAVNESLWTGVYGQGLSLYMQEGLFGLLDRTGAVVASPKYDRIFLPHDDCAIVCSSDRYGILRLNGEEILEPQYSFISDFKEGHAWYSAERLPGAGLIDTDGARLDIPVKSVVHKINGQYLVTTIGGHRILNRTGEAIFEVDYKNFVGSEGPSPFAQNRDPWLSYDEHEDDVNASRQAAWDYDHRHPTDIPEDLPLYFQNDLAIAPSNSEGQIKLGFINRAGDWVVEPKLDNAQRFVNGYACAMLKQKWGIINRNGDWVVSPKYEYLKSTNGRHFVHSDQGSLGLIGIDEQVLISAEYSAIKYLFGDLFGLKLTKENSTEQPTVAPRVQFDNNLGKWGVFNVVTADQILDFQYDFVGAVNQNLGLATRVGFSEVHQSKNPPLSNMSEIQPRDFEGVSNSKVFGRHSVIESLPEVSRLFKGIRSPNQIQMQEFVHFKSIGNSTIIGERAYNEIGEPVLSENLLAQIRRKVNRHGLSLSFDSDKKKYGVINRTGRFVLSHEFDSIQFGHSGIIVQKEGSYGYFDFSGFEILPILYREVREEPTGVLRTRMNGTEFTLISRQGEKLNNER